MLRGWISGQRHTLSARCYRELTHLEFLCAEKNILNFSRYQVPCCDSLVSVRTVLVHRYFADERTLTLLHSLIGENFAALLMNGPKVARRGGAHVESSALKAN